MFFNTEIVSLAAIAEATGAKIVGDTDDHEIHGAGPIEAAGASDITFVDNPKYLKFLGTTKATAVFIQEQHADQLPETVVGLIHAQPYKAYSTALSMLYPTASRPQPVTGETGISPMAVISKDVQIEPGVIIEAGAVIGTGAAIGSGSAILAGAVIGAGVQIGRNTTIGTNSTVVCAFIGDSVIVHSGVRIGQDGFGFAMGPGGHLKVAQIGRVVIQDRVEIGANSTIDRGSNRDTVIGEGTKIDNLVQIGHNVTIGCHCVIVALVGISGSATVGDYVVIAGQAGLNGHITVGDGAQIGGGSGVHGDVPPGKRVMGYPAVSAQRWMRAAAKELLADKKSRR